MRISAYWIVKNEAENIGVSIESVRRCVDEMIVVDTGSTDNTVEIAKSLGAKVAFYKWASDFSAARNYALDMASGDLIVVMDGDELFSPPLEKEDHAKLCKLFDDNPEISGCFIHGRNIDKTTGALINTCQSLRFFRHRKEMRYHGKVHEQLLCSGNLLVTILSPEWNVDHTGYSASVIQDKITRNISLLNTTLHNSPDRQQQFLCHCYLVREYYVQGVDYEKAFSHLMAILTNHDRLHKLLVELDIRLVEILYAAMQLSHYFRPKINRNQVYNGLVAPLQTALPHYCGAPLFPLWYQALFDMKEDIFLKQLPSSLSQAAQLTSSTAYALELQAALHVYASIAELRRNNKESAIYHASAAIKTTPKHPPKALRVLLSCLKGQPAADILLFLSGLFDLKDPATLRFLTHHTIAEGFAETYAYIVKKQMDLNCASEMDFLFLLVLFNKYEESMKAALSMLNQSATIDKATIVSHLLLAVVCSDQKEYYNALAPLMSSYSHLLEAFFDHHQPSTLTENDELLFQNTYPYIVLALGHSRAEKFAHLFNSSLACKSFKISYMEENCLYQEILLEDWSDIDRSNYSAYRALMQSHLSLGQYAESFALIKDFFEKGILEKDFLDILLVIAEKAPLPISAEARALYDHSIALYDASIDSF